MRRRWAKQLETVRLKRERVRAQSWQERLLDYGIGYGAALIGPILLYSIVTWGLIGVCPAAWMLFGLQLLGYRDERLHPHIGLRRR